MHTLLAIADVVAAAPAFAGDLVLAKANVNTGQQFADTVRDFIAPLVLLAVGIAALTFLFKRQVNEFIQFFCIAIGVAVFFYFPGFLEGIAEFLSNALGGGGGGGKGKG